MNDEDWIEMRAYREMKRVLRVKREKLGKESIGRGQRFGVVGV